MSKDFKEVKDLIEEEKRSLDILKPFEKKEVKNGDGNIKLSLNDLKNELCDLGLFYGALSHLGLQKQYDDAPDDKVMSFKDFKIKIGEFLKQPIYKEDMEV